MSYTKNYTGSYDNCTIQLYPGTFTNKYGSKYLPQDTIETIRKLLLRETKYDKLKLTQYSDQELYCIWFMNDNTLQYFKRTHRFAELYSNTIMVSIYEDQPINPLQFPQSPTMRTERTSIQRFNINDLIIDIVSNADDTCKTYLTITTNNVAKLNSPLLTKLLTLIPAVQQ